MAGLRSCSYTTATNDSREFGHSRHHLEAGAIVVVSRCDSSSQCSIREAIWNRRHPFSRAWPGH